MLSAQDSHQIKLVPAYSECFQDGILLTIEHIHSVIIFLYKQVIEKELKGINALRAAKSNYLPFDFELVQRGGAERSLSNPSRSERPVNPRERNSAHYFLLIFCLTGVPDMIFPAVII